MPVYFNRFRAGQRVNIPRHIGRQRMPMGRNTTIFLGSPQGGHHCCCGGGVSGFGRFLAGVTGACTAAFMGVAALLVGLFGRGKAQQTQQTYDTAALSGAGYTQGLYGSFYNPFGSYTPYAGNTSAAQLADSSSRTQAQKELDAMNNNKKYNYTNGQIPSVTDDGKYKYGDQTYDTISDLEAAIEKDQKTSAAPAVTVHVSEDNEETDVEEKDGKGGRNTAVSNNKTVTTPDDKTDYTNEYNTKTGFSYSNNMVTITDQNVPEIVTLSAFILNDNDESTISLTKKDWENDFKLIAEKNSTMTEEQFTKWFENYVKEAKNAKSPRVATNTVNMTDSDKEFIKQLYKAMSNNGKTLSATQFKTFMEGFFKDTNYSSDGSFSRKEFAEYVQKSLMRKIFR